VEGFVSFTISAITQLGLFSLIPFIWWLITAKQVSFFKWIGLKKPKFSISVAKFMAIAISVSVLYTVAMIVIMQNMLGETGTATSQFSSKGIGVLPQILVYAIVQTGLSEEIFFRGFLCKRFTNRFGFKVGNTLQALIFGLVHGIPFGIATRNIPVCVLLIVLPGTIGWLQGWMNEKCSSGSIIPSWLFHATMNVFSALAAAIG